MPMIKRVLKLTLALMLLVACFSCKKHLLIDITGEPDMVIENMSGTLYYDKDGFKILKMWYVSPLPENDTGHNWRNRYFIAEMPDKKFPLMEAKQVLISGLCYYIPYDAFGFPEGLDVMLAYVPYYIKITNISYQ